MAYDWSLVQAELSAQRFDGWLVVDFRNNNPVLGRILGTKAHLTRRVFWYLPASGSPRVLCHRIDEEAFARLGVPREVYGAWGELPGKLRGLVGGARRVAMEYVPGGLLPAVSIVDGGTLEMVRDLGLEIGTSADLVQLFAARWSSAGLAAHRRASAQTKEIMAGAFAWIGKALRERGECQEREVQGWVVEQFRARGLHFDDAPIVSVNANSGVPHYAPDAVRSSVIRRGDWVLIDMWCRDGDEEGVYSDITQTGFCGQRVPEEHRRVFDVVRGARDAALARAQGAFAKGEAVCGWELDEAARAVIVGAGFGEFIRHRTGHSLSPGGAVHGIGMNLDNTETRDTRRMLVGTGFTIEPGVYLPGFGVRNEINVYVDAQNGPVATSCVQDEPVLIV